MADYLENKCYYPMLYPTAKHPKVFARKQHNIWTDQNNCLINHEELENNLKKCNDVLFVKFATNSFGGHGVFHYKSGFECYKEILKQVDEHQGDIVIQFGIKQHPALSAFNSSSVNTIRVLSLLRDNKVTIYSCFFRMGLKNATVDNSACGGINIGVLPNGRLRDIAHFSNGELCKYKHPDSGIEFSSFVIPSFDKIIEKVKECHPYTPYFGLIQWDFAVDEDGDPVVVEAGFKYGELYGHQLNNGPLFGEDTKMILDEVYNIK